MSVWLCLINMMIPLYSPNFTIPAILNANDLQYQNDPCSTAIENRLHIVRSP